PRYRQTRSPNAARSAVAVAGTGVASGTTTIARRAWARHALTAWTATACSSSGAGRRRNVPDALPIASSISVPPRYPERVAGTVASSGPSGFAGRCSAPSLVPAATVSSPATLGGDSTPSTVASGATYRSLVHLASWSIGSSKNRTGETSRITGSILPGSSSAGPTIHARVSLPWNRTRTYEPTPASSSAGSMYVNGRSRERTGRSMQTATGPESASGADGAPERVGAIRGLPGELLAPEMSVGGRLLVDRTSQIQIADDRRRAEVEDLPDGLLELDGIDLLGVGGVDHQ